MEVIISIFLGSAVGSITGYFMNKNTSNGGGTGGDTGGGGSGDAGGGSGDAGGGSGDAGGGSGDAGGGTGTDGGGDAGTDGGGDGSPAALLSSINFTSGNFDESINELTVNIEFIDTNNALTDNFGLNFLSLSLNSVDIPITENKIVKLNVGRYTYPVQLSSGQSEVGLIYLDTNAGPDGINISKQIQFDVPST